ncbi:non-ribosomal peptide synthetase [Paenibacillus sp. SYP-B4298]|uniref:non-ribosomal peptide synthetase n=1 Tax=Paenibacillus sp. SYP-B4298 TaxID=2996034 RepID=UPI0022DD83F5|nr:non-ribosomal peptide synthetase [Paenibacillus sp. SYP-B4298]
MTLKNMEDFYPLSPMQQGMLFHSLYAPESGVYIIQSALHLSGALDDAAWERAWQQLVQRHAILRASVISEDVKEPIQVVHRSVELPLERLDWRDLSADEQSGRLERYLSADRSRGFELTNPPLLRLALIRMEEERYAFVLTIHHLLVDGWSIGVLFQEVFQLYEAFRNGEERVLGTVQPYRNYIGWLRKQRPEQTESFWRQKLQGANVPTPLALGGLPNPHESDNERRIQLSEEETSLLQAFAKQQRVTMSTVLQGAWALVLSRVSREEDVVFGSVVSGRPHTLPGAESMVGLFINTLPVRVTVPGHELAAEWLQALQAELTQLRAYEHSPLLEVQQWSGLTGGQRLFDSLVVFENYPIDGTVIERHGGLKLAGVQSYEQTGYPITIIALPGPSFEMQLLFDPARFAGEAIERLLEQLKTVLNGFVQYADQPLSSLPSLSEQELNRMLVEWNRTERPLAGMLTAHRRFAERAAAAPSQAAISAGKVELTYAELERRSNQLAHYLRGAGVGRETLVAICAERSAELVVGLLGIMKAGGAYVPLDPGYPRERLQFILEDTGAPLLLTQAHVAERLPERRPRTIALDADWPHLECANDQPPPDWTELSDLAYVIYTSGSTGRPKGVEVTHAALLHLIEWHCEAYMVTAQDRATLIAGTAFDASVWEIWPYLTAGASLLVPDEECRLMPEQLQEWLLRQRITISFLPTPLGERLLELDWPASAPLRALLVGGDTLHRYADPALPFQLFNNYGPTENTVVATSGLVPTAERATRPTIGRPISNTQVYILDHHRQAVPVGVAGELYIAGKSLARGYWGQPELTARKFVRHLNARSQQERMYATGDLCRYTPEGEIEYVGRMDDQVSVRGFRVELGEIEQTLLRYPGIREAAVLIRPGASGEPRLLAYVAPSLYEDAMLQAEQLRSFMQAELPDYMVPPSITVLERLPLTANGKVDRNGLPEPLEAVSTQGYEAPRNEAEEQLASIWSEVLGVGRVGIHDNYFTLGGDSILSIQIVNRAKKHGLQLTPKHLFEHQTIAALAQAATRARRITAIQGVVEGEVCPTPIQGWFLERELAAPHHFNQGLMLTVQPSLSPALLQRALDALVAHHDALRLRVEGTGRTARLYNAGTGRPVSLTVIDLSHLGREQQVSALEDEAQAAQRRIRLDEGMLLNAVYFRLKVGEPCRLLLIIHHLAVDGVSWRILLDDLHTLCGQLLDQRQTELPPKTTSLLEWSAQLKRFAQSAQVQAEAAYWMSERYLQEPAFPVDQDGGSYTAAASGQTMRRLSNEQTRQLLTEVPAAYRTQINDVLLTALARAMSAWTKDRRLLLYLEGHGREEIGEELDLSRTVGWFTAMFPVLLELPERLDPGLHLKSVKEQLRAIPGRGLGYGLLRYMSRHAEAEALPVPKLSFNYLGQFDHLLPAGQEALFGGAPESMGDEVDPAYRREQLLDISGVIAGGGLSMTWVYSRNHLNPETIERLADLYMRELGELIAHCCRPGTGGITVSDVPLAQVTAEQLEQIYDRYPGMEDLFPLTPMQEGMLYHSIESPDSGLYCEQCVFTVLGAPDEQLLRRAWRELLQRHEILRTCVMQEGLDRPHLVLLKEAAVPIEYADLSAVPGKEQPYRLELLLESDKIRGFEFDQSPLMRVTVVRLDEQRHQLIWTFHHLLLDGWSVPTVIREWFTLYEAYAAGAHPQLEAVPSYRNYAAWLAKQDMEAAREYWQRYMKGLESPSAIMGTVAAGTEQPDVQELRVKLGSRLTGELDAMARSGQLTLSTLLQGAWGLALSRYSGEADVLFGTTVSGRPAELEGVEAMVGLFINTLPVRQLVSPQLAVLEWLRQLQAAQTDMRQYEYLSLAEIHRLSEIPRGTPLFESLLVYENYPVLRPDAEVAAAIAPEASSQAMELVDIATHERTNYPITITVIPGEELELRAAYDSARYSEPMMQQLLGHVRRLLESMTERPSSPVGELPMLAAAEEQRLLQEWDATVVSYPRNKTIGQLFTEQADRTPEALALVFGESQMTYAELNRRADRVASYLRKLGVGPEVPVGLALERSIEAIIALVGIVKAGGIYIPLDPDYPEERLRLMAEETKLRLLVTERSVQQGLPAAERVILLDEEWERMMREPVAPWRASGDAQQLAYVMYTSGSTGRPKGVAVSHRAVVRLALGLEEARLGPGEVMLQFAPVSFDASTFEIWGSLLRGGTLAIMPPGLPSVQELGEYMVECGVTVAWLTAPLFHTMVDEYPQGLRGLKQLWAGGDTLSVPHVRKALELEGLEVVNGYGPTENTTFTCYYRIPQGQSQTIPIGRPVQGTDCYILDKSGRLMPLGMPGELYVGGDGLARGYLNQPELTAEKFVAHPFKQGERLYRTGDLVRYSPEGWIEFLGRLDHQVKVRGYRIEPGEIERELSMHPAVGQAVVVAHTGSGGEKRLVAYAALSGTEETVTEEQLRDYMKERLPDYMVPTVIMLLDVLPLLPSGKVNRAQLPEPKLVSQARYVAPTEPQELALAAIWSEVLGIDQVGRHDNFFELGGDSILSIQIVARAQQAGLKLTPKQLFHYQTIAELAAVAESTAAPQAEQGRVEGEVPLTPVQHWFFHLPLASRSYWNQSFMLELHVQLQPEQVQQMLQLLVSHHDALRMRFEEVDGGWRQYNAGECEVALVCEELSQLSAEQQQQRIEAVAAELQTGMDLQAGRVWSAAWFGLGDQPARLFLAIHHLVVDGVSWRILLEDVETLCQQLAAGDPPALPPKTTSFQQWAKRLAEEAQRGTYRKHLPFWESMACTWIPRVPLDYAADDDELAELNTLLSAETVSVELDEESTRLLLQQVPAAYRTRIDEALLSALLTAMENWTGSSKLLLHLEGHGREQLEGTDLSRTVGWFTSIYPVLLDSSQTDGVISRLLAVKEQLRAVPERGFGFGIVRYLDEDERCQELKTAFPEVEISYNYLGQMSSLYREDGLLRQAKESSGMTQEAGNARQHMIDVAGMVVRQQLHLMFTYSTNLHRRETIEQVADDVRHALLELVRHCQSEETSHSAAYTPSDFPEAELSQKQLDRILKKMDSGRNS